MSDDELAGRLREVPLFREVDDEHLRRVAQAATPFDVEPGFVLIERGHAGSGMFVLTDGTVEIDVPNREPVTREAGDFVGELSLLTDAPRVARVQARTNVRGVAISRSAFWELLDSEPRVAVAMLPELARRLVASETERT
jgi:CRP-like cAMP-binding protein